MEVGSSRAKALLKSLIRPLPVQDRKDEGSRDLLAQSPVHASEWTREATAAAQQRKEAKTKN